jgi:hypothetical protein
MKITDFGLWFMSWGGDIHCRWSTTIPPEYGFSIYYDGVELGYQSSDFGLSIYMNGGYPGCEPYLHTIKLKNRFRKIMERYYIGRPLTLDDFEIVESPEYRGAV